MPLFAKSIFVNLLLESGEGPPKASLSKTSQTPSLETDRQCCIVDIGTAEDDFEIVSIHEVSVALLLRLASTLPILYSTDHTSYSTPVDRRREPVHVIRGSCFLYFYRQKS